MDKFFANWKTTSIGLASVFVALADLLHPTNGVPDLHGDITAILAGLGFILGKDWNK